MSQLTKYLELTRRTRTIKRLSVGCEERKSRSQRARVTSSRDVPANRLLSYGYEYKLGHSKRNYQLLKERLDSGFIVRAQTHERWKINIRCKFECVHESTELGIVIEQKQTKESEQTLIVGAAPACTVCIVHCARLLSDEGNNTWECTSGEWPRRGDRRGGDQWPPRA